MIRLGLGASLVLMGTLAGAAPAVKAPKAAPGAGVQSPAGEGDLTPAGGRTPVPVVPAVALHYRTERLKAAFRSGRPDDVNAAIQEVDLLRRTYGTLDVMPLVDAMAIHARDLGNAGQPALGLEVIRALERWAPRNPTLLGTRVVLQRQQGPAGYLWSMADVFELTRLRVTHPVHRWLWLVQHIAWLRLMATLLLWGWALTLVLRYRRVFRHQWEQPLAQRGVHPQVAALLGAFLVCFPVIVGLDPGLCAMIWLVLLVPFLVPQEVKVSLLVVAIQLVHPALALLEPMASRRPDPSLVTLQLRPQMGTDEKALSGLPPSDRSFLKGWRLLQAQQWAPAEALFTDLARSQPDSVECLNNLGVARYQRGDVQGAQTCFDDAARRTPARVEVLLNQSVVAFKKMDSILGAQKQEEAQALDHDGCMALLEANQAGLDQRTFAIPLPDTPARLQALRQGLLEPGRDAQAPKDRSFLLNLILPLAALGLLLFRLRRSVNQAHPSQCTRCGDPFHTTDSPDGCVCSKCHHLFVLKDGLHGESRKRKVDEVASFQRTQGWLHRALILLLPGADRCFMGDTLPGFVEFVFLCFAFGMALATGRSVRYPGEVLPDPASIWLPLGLGLLGVLYVRSWLKLVFRRF